MQPLLRKRYNHDQLPKISPSPKPSLNSPGHVSSNRQHPTLAPTIFTFLIIFLTILLIPVFYYTQVMITDPSSSSFLSQFRIKGNTILSALGHHSSQGSGRIQFMSTTSSSNEHSQFKSASTETHNPFSQQHIQESNQELFNAQAREKSIPRILDDSQSLEAKLEEEIGRTWLASSQYRARAQQSSSGQYSLRGDGTNANKDLNKDSFSSSDLPHADPQAKEGLTPEIWESIKQKVSANDLKAMLDSVRKQESSSQSQP